VATKEPDPKVDTDTAVRAPLAKVCYIGNLSNHD